MTATPIPRTLNMSLSGLRDMSVIETPPRDRLAIQTVVVKFRTSVIENAINFELDRGGQVYVVHNRVESIYSLADLVRRLCPRARVGVGHAQMSEKELETVMTRFMHHEFDVLVATTIIENGLDIPLANTLIVNRADRFGLSQLYQLRGRVGRSNRRAYAYLLIPSDESLTPIARRRLAAIREFSDLGAGFRIAALDLELRGAGNLLGGQQHGHIEAIGFDLYCQLLERTVEELKNGSGASGSGNRHQPEVRPENTRPTLLMTNCSVCASTSRSRPRGPRTRSTVCTVSWKTALERFPLQIRNLLEYARLRVLGRGPGRHVCRSNGRYMESTFAFMSPPESIRNGLSILWAPASASCLSRPRRFALRTTSSRSDLSSRTSGICCGRSPRPLRWPKEFSYEKSMGLPRFSNHRRQPCRAAQQKIDQIAARVNGDIILKSEVDRELDLRRIEMAQQGMDAARIEPGAGRAVERSYFGISSIGHSFCRSPKKRA